MHVQPVNAMQHSLVSGHHSFGKLHSAGRVPTVEYTRIDYKHFANHFNINHGPSSPPPMNFAIISPCSNAQNMSRHKIPEVAACRVVFLSGARASSTSRTKYT